MTPASGDIFLKIVIKYPNIRCTVFNRFRSVYLASSKFSDVQSTFRDTGNSEMKRRYLSSNSKSWVKSVFFFTWPYVTWKYVQAYVSYRAENHSFPILGIEEPLTLALFLFFNCGKIYMTSNWLLGIFKCTSQGDFYSLHNLSFKEHLCRALLEKHEAVKEVDVQIFHFFFFFLN